MTLITCIVETGMLPHQGICMEKMLILQEMLMQQKSRLLRVRLEIGL